MESEGFVDSSSAAIAAVRSLILKVVVVVVVVLCGLEVPECAVPFACFILTLGKSDIRLPDAEGGSLCRGGDGSREDDGEGEYRFCVALGV